MALAVAASTVATSVPAYAAFDATYYAQQNPDVVAAIGTKPADLEMHYNVFGKKEGRAGSADEIGSSALRQLFDAEYYAKMNPDVAAVYGNDANALFSHFLQFGIKEGRRINPYFDVNAYKKAYPDLVAAFGDDIAAYYNHFATNGIKEHRTLGGFPAEKIVPGVAVAAASDSGSSSGGGGGSSSSSKPSTKPADTTPAPTPTPTPTPEPEPEPEPTPEPTSQDYIDEALAVREANNDLAADLLKYYYDDSTGNKGAVQNNVALTKGERDALVSRALSNLEDANELKTIAAANLESAKAENAAAQKAFADATNAVSEASKSNNALVQFTSGKKVITDVGNELTDYYAAVEDVANKQRAANQAAEALEEAKALAADSQKNYDKAMENVKSTLLAIDSNQKASDLDKQTDAAVVTSLIGKAGKVLEMNAGAVALTANEIDSTYLLDGATGELKKDANGYTQEKLKIMYANKLTYDALNTLGDLNPRRTLITDSGRVIDSVYGQITDAYTKSEKNTLLPKAQKAYLETIVNNPDNYDGTSKELNAATQKRLLALGFTQDEIDTYDKDDADAGTVPALTLTNAMKEALTADSAEMKSANFAITNAGTAGEAVTVVTAGTVGALSFDGIVDEAVKVHMADIDASIDAFKATSVGGEYYVAEADKTAKDNGVTVAENAKEVADENLDAAEELVADTAEAVAEAKKERDDAYLAAGVAGNAALVARDEAQENAIKEAYEERVAQTADRLAQAEYRAADTNYNDAAGLVATQ